MQGNIKKLKNWEEFVSKKYQARHARNEELSIQQQFFLRQWVRLWVRFRIYRTKKNLCQIQENFTMLNQEAVLERSRILSRCNSGLPRNTQNCTTIMGNVFERPPAQEGQHTTILRNSMNFTSSSQELRSDVSETARREREQKKETFPYMDSVTHFQSWCGLRGHIGETCCDFSGSFATKKSKKQKQNKTTIFFNKKSNQKNSRKINFFGGWNFCWKFKIEKIKKSKYTKKEKETPKGELPERLQIASSQSFSSTSLLLFSSSSPSPGLLCDESFKSCGDPR